MALVRAGDGEDHSEEIRSLLDSSRNASRLAARTRFVVDLPESNAPGSSLDLSHLGRTRDVVTLVWTGRRLRNEGKADSAIRAYRSAMEIASKTSLADLDPPTFFEDPQVRRYALPRESLLGFVAKAMAEDGEWTREQWAEALPPSAAASLVTSRVLAKMQKRADADRLADLAIRQNEVPTPPGYDPAEDRAAGAEALAYRGRWTDAAEQYRRAIDQAEDDATRRMWWLNLAEVAQRVGDDAGRVRAIEAAKSPTSVDEITRRALRYQQSLPGFASPPSSR
jgi:tetratricopeptide (TPR) repeat protein